MLQSVRVCRANTVLVINRLGFRWRRRRLNRIDARKSCFEFLGVLLIPRVERVNVPQHCETDDCLRIRISLPVGIRQRIERTNPFPKIAAQIIIAKEGCDVERQEYRECETIWSDQLALKISKKDFLEENLAHRPFLGFGQ